MAGRIQQSNTAREVLRNISPRVTIVAKLNELNRKRFIEAFGSQHDLIILAAGLRKLTGRGKPAARLQEPTCLPPCQTDTAAVGMLRSFSS